MEPIDDVLIYVDSFEKMFKGLKLGLILDIFIFILITSALFALVKVFDKKLRKRLCAKDSEFIRFVPILNRVFKGLILFFMLATFLQSHGYSMNSIIAGFGITGLAIGFAAKETIANVFGTMSIIADKSYKIGDCININGIEGVVEDINMRSTKLRGYDNKVLIVPNNTVAGSVVTNISQIKKHRIIDTISLNSNTDDKKIQEAIDIINNILENHEDISKDYSVNFATLSANSVDISVKAYTKTKDGNKFCSIRQEVFFEIIKQYRKAKIEFASPSIPVYIEKKA